MLFNIVLELKSIDYTMYSDRMHFALISKTIVAAQIKTPRFTIGRHEFLPFIRDSFHNALQYACVSCSKLLSGASIFDNRKTHC